MKKQNTSTPLFITLDEQRTRGIWGLAENHVSDQINDRFNYSILSNMTNTVGEVWRQNFSKHPNDKFKDQNTLHRCIRAKANAEYIILSVNNLRRLAEAIQAIIKYDNESGLREWVRDFDFEEGNEFGDILDKAKSALKAIS